MAALALMILLTGSCTLPSAVDKADEASADFIRQFQSVLDQRAQHLATRDIEGFLRPIVAEAREAELVLARGFVAAGAETPSFSIPSSFDATSRQVDVTVRFHYRYEGLPTDNPFSFPIAYAVAQARDSLRITRSEPGPEQLPIWALGEVEPTSTKHFLALARPATPGVEDVLQTAESARAAMEPRLPVRLDDMSLIIAAGDDLDFSRLVTPSESSAEGRVAQVGTLVQVTPDEVRVEGRHVVVNLKQLAEDRTGPQTLRHELAHLALAPVTRPTTPGWVAEGAAMYLAESRPTEAWATGMREGRFTEIRIADLNRQAHLGLHDPSGRSASAEYLYASATVAFLIERFGPDSFWKFYRSFAEQPAGKLYEVFSEEDQQNGLQELRAEVAKALLEASYGFSAAELDGEMRAWLRSISGTVR